MFSRRKFLHQGLALAATLSLPRFWSPPAFQLSRSDGDLLDELCASAFRYFWEAADPYTGLVKDRSDADGLDPRTVGSSTETLFCLTAVCITAENEYEKRSKIEERVLRTLKYFQERALREH